MSPLALLSVVLSAAALFLLEPFVGKVLLPRFGGTPMVWNTCVMVFQALLIGGYWYAVRLGRFADVRAAARRHAIVVAVAVLSWPFTVRYLWVSPPPDSSPVWWITVIAIAAIGLPFIVLSATSPLVQVWLARGAVPVSRVHRLYAASNIASVGALILYAAVIEPFMGVRAQAWLILGVGTAGALLSLASANASAIGSRQAAIETPNEHSANPIADYRLPITNGTRLTWVFLSFAASLCLFAVNAYLATDVASFPLLFVLPLAIFLLAFAAGFSAWAERFGRWVVVFAMAAGGYALYYLLRVAQPATNLYDLPGPLIGLAGLVTALAAALAKARPADHELPGYYTLIGVGGLAAGIVSVILLPWGWTTVSAPLHRWPLLLVNSPVPEYPVALVLGMWLIARNWPMRVVAFAALVMMCTARSDSYGVSRLYEARNFYGTVRVMHDPSSSTNRLKNGTTLHGFQVMREGVSVPTSYYHPSSPIGQLVRTMGPKNVTAFGLGVGTLAAYARNGDDYTFLEINPLVATLADHSEYFSYLRQARERGGAITIRIGDGRLLAATLPDASTDLIVLDAFSSDSIPVHLITVEALREYVRKLTPRGVIAVHVSNRFFELGPNVAASAEAIGWWWAIQERDEEEADESASTWVMLVRDEQVGASYGLTESPWRRPEVPAGVEPWTDDWANLLGRLKAVARKFGTSFY